MGVKILLADDHQIVRDGLRALIEKRSNMTLVAEAETGRQAVKLAMKHNPDVIIMDIAMPELNGIEATRQIISDSPNVKIIILSMHSDRMFVSEALKAGAAGYLLKDDAFEELTHAIKAVVKGKVYLSPSIAKFVVKDYVSSKAYNGSKLYTELSSREREVLQLMAEGWSTREIASDLSLSVKTIETHRCRIMKKLDIHTVAELTKFAIREGLTSL